MAYAAHTAFDYERQVWITGEAARLLLISQARETVELLESPEGEAFATWNGEPLSVTLAAALAALTLLDG